MTNRFKLLLSILILIPFVVFGASVVSRTDLNRGQVGSSSINTNLDALVTAINTAPAKAYSGTPVNAVAAAVVLTMDTQPTVGDTFTIGTKVFTFTTDETASADGEVDVGADVADAKIQVVAAINGTDHNTAHTLVTAAAFSGDACTITAKTKGTSGNSIASTETFTAGTNVFAAATLLLGVDSTTATAGQVYYDATYLYVSVGTSIVSTQYWRRIAVGSAY